MSQTGEKERGTDGGELNMSQSYTAKSYGVSSGRIDLP